MVLFKKMHRKSKKRINFKIQYYYMKITAKFSGEQKNLEMFLNCGVTDFSSKFLGINNLSVAWVVDEESNEKAIEDCMSMVNTYQMELWDIEFKSIS